MFTLHMYSHSKIINYDNNMPMNRSITALLFVNVQPNSISRVVLPLPGVEGNTPGGGMCVQLRNLELQNSRFELLPLSSLNQAKREADAYAFSCQYKASQPSRLCSCLLVAPLGNCCLAASGEIL
jgi:hypothetical protein